MNYTRKRALLACDFCRHRKRRCDGKRPCSTCKDSNADCVYKELPYDRLEDASPSAVVDRLARIEALLEQQSQQLRSLSTTSSTPTNMSVAAFDYFPSPTFAQASGFVEPPQAPLDNLGDAPSFLIPKGHTTPASTLLSEPKVRELLGEYPRDFFYSIEENQPLPDSLRSSYGNRRGWPPLRQDALTKLADKYFRSVHPHHPLFSQYTFGIWQTKLLNKETLEDAEAAICLCVYALGAVLMPQGSMTTAAGDALGLQFFKPALDIILYRYTWDLRPDLVLCQALLLASSYFSHLGRPLHCWRMAFFASQRFLHYTDARHVQISFPDYGEAELRVFWQCFLVECNGAAELDVPRSGIEPLGDKMPLPHSLDPDDHEETIHFIAEIAIRRLLNRIHCSLYCPASPESSTAAIDPSLTWQGLSLSNLIALSSELDRQLEEWYTSIPDGIRPSRDMIPNSTDRSRVLRIRYYEARHIIHRPFVLQAGAQQQQQQRRRAPASSSSSSETHAAAADVLPQIVVDKCEICVDSCAAYLYNAVEMLDKRTPYLWSLAQSCMACLIVLMIADGVPALRKFVPGNMRHLQEMVTARVKRWAGKGSSFEAEVAILEGLVFREEAAGSG